MVIRDRIYNSYYEIQDVNMILLLFPWPTIVLFYIKNKLQRRTNQPFSLFRSSFTLLAASQTTEIKYSGRNSPVICLHRETSTNSEWNKEKAESWIYLVNKVFLTSNWVITYSLKNNPRSIFLYMYTLPRPDVQNYMAQANSHFFLYKNNVISIYSSIHDRTKNKRSWNCNVKGDDTRTSANTRRNEFQFVQVHRDKGERRTGKLDGGRGWKKMDNTGENKCYST